MLIELRIADSTVSTCRRLTAWTSSGLDAGRLHLLLARSTSENESGGRCRVHAEGLSEPTGKVLSVGSEYPLRSIRCWVV
ncbi:hypothetical protein, partial [Xanthomonas citri]|uniref:hypothetical protein n=1 Tax=Xanthomonas citri TaxID=346 RepID=UPI002AB2B884